MRLPLAAACAALALTGTVLFASDAGVTANEPSAPEDAPPSNAAASPPDTPAHVSVTRGDGSLTATWSAVEGATSYHVTYTWDFPRRWLLAALNHTDSTITITEGVANDWPYVVAVRARNAHGDSGWRNSEPAPPFTPLPPPDSVTVTRGDGTLKATWPAVEGATSYHVTYSSDGGASWSLAALNHPEASITIEGVSNDETYIVGVRARSSADDSGWRNSAPAGPFTPLSAPESVTVTRGDGTLMATWPAVKGATSYHVTYSSDSGVSWSLAALNHPEASITIEGVANDETYTVRVRARSSADDSGWRNSAPAGPFKLKAAPPPAAPTGLRIIAGDGNVILVWNDPSDPTITGYEYAMREAPPAQGWGEWTAVPNSGADTTRHAIDGLTNGREYRFKVRAVSAAGASEPAPESAPWYVAATPGEGARAANHTDYDTDNDNLIEIATEAQFIAIQWDLDGNGTASSGNEASYAAAFAHAVSGMGCASTCAGYEFNADLTIGANPSNAGTNYLVPGTLETTIQGNDNTITNGDRRPLFENIGAATGSTTGEVKGLNVHNGNGQSAILANLVQANGKVTNTGVTGSTSISGNGTYGGLVNTLNGGIISGSHSYADVEVSAGETAIGTTAQWGVGGLVGRVQSGEVLSSHATGNVTYRTTGGNTWDSQGRRYVGGLVGWNQGTIYASYAWGSVRATENYRSNSWTRTVAGGLIGRVDSGATVRAGYATGSVSRTGTSIIRIHNEFGSAVGESAGTVNYVYGSGSVTTSGTEQNPTGTSKKTETELKTPTGYTGIYANWNFDIDNADNDDSLTTGTDDPWHFGTSTELPVFDYTPQGGTPLPPADLRPASLTLTASSTTIAEGSTTTITASLGSTRGYDVRVTQPDNETRYSYDITVAKGDTSSTGTFTSVANTSPTSDISVALTGSRTYPSNQVTIVSTSSTIAIQDDEIHGMSNVAATQAKQQDGTYDITVTWDAPGTENTRNATGYDLDYRLSTDTTWTTVNISGIATVTHTLENLTVYRTYDIRVRAKSASLNGAYSSTVSVAVGDDYDADDDGLIDMGNLAQLDAIRYDLNADGAVSSTDETNYLAAFTNAAPDMGCPSTGCTGYELSANLDFDTDGDGSPDSGDTYWNSGNGWDPIGGVSGSSYTGDFNGNTYTISNLFIDRTSGNYAGLFAKLDGASARTVENVSLVNVDVTLKPTTSEHVYAGGLAGYSGTRIEDSYVTGRVRAGESATEPVTFGSVNDYVYIGGLVGQLQAAAITGSHSLADVTTNIAGGSNDVAGRAGGLAGYTAGAGASVDASYAGGDVTVGIVTTGIPTAIAGGLVGDYSGTGGGIRASYARGDVSATISSSGNALAGGLAGSLATDTITASFSTGAVTRTVTSGTFLLGSAGGLVGFRNTGTATNSYWDTATSGVTTSPLGTGKTTSQLQTPTGYTGDYANWNLNLDGVTGNDDPWAFGTASQYPVLKYGGQTAANQRVTVTLTVNPATIWERALTTPSRVNATTLTVTPSRAWDENIVVTLPASDAVYTLGAATVTFSDGSTTAVTTTLTAVNNFTDAANNAVDLAITADSPWVTIGTAPTVTINDDDELTKPTGVKLSVDGAKIRVDWTAVTGATGYKVQWSTTNTFTTKSEGTVSSGSTTNYTINPTPALTANTRYYVRVLPTKSGADEPPSDVADVKTHATGANATVDYDADNDGLIDVSTLAQLNAIRWDLDGNGVASSGNETSYATAFPNAEDNMGCNESTATITAGTGNPACSGYELSANLDFNTNSSAASSTNPSGADSGDTYWNGGSGWDPIGGVSGGDYTGDFNGDTYTISNLFIDRTGGNYAGLFADLNGANQTIENVSLVNVDVTLNVSTSDSVYVGGLAGHVGSTTATIEDSYTTGRVRAGESSSEPVTLTAVDGISHVGGLVGRTSGGHIVSSYSLADVTGYSTSTVTKVATYAGGLVGYAGGSGITASFAAGDVTANTVAQNNSKAYAGGLAGVAAAEVRASYARGAVSADYDATATSSVTGTVWAGGLVGRQIENVTASFSTGAATATGDGTLSAGGLVGAKTGGTTTYSYWDTEASGIAATGEGTGKTTSQLKTPTAYGTGANDIYKDWNLNLDGVAGNDDPWNFGTATEYPVLKHGALSGVTQRVTVTLTASPLEIWERALTSPSRVNQTTITATPGVAWHDAIAITLPQNAAYSLGSSTLTINAGSTTAVTTTLTAVNNLTDASDFTLALNTITLGRWVVAASTQTINIKDDDELTKPTGVRLSVDGTKIRVDWTAVTGATGYKVQWNSTSNASWTNPSEGTVSSGSTTSYTVNPTPALSAGTRYYVRVLPTKSGADEPPSDVADTTTHGTSPATVDYDADNDGLIEITTLGHLNAVRWDLDGDGVGDRYDSNNDGDYTDTGEYDYTANYTGAFPNAEDNMGCNESAVSIASNNTGNPACSGYELSNNLDFDTNSDGRTDITGDTYWNGGKGWRPIADDSTTHNTSTMPFNAVFEGNNYVISNLFINRNAGCRGVGGACTWYQSYAGLFGDLGSSAKVRNLGLEDVSVTLSSTANLNPAPEVYAGGLAGHSAAEIFKTYVTGTVSASGDGSSGNDKAPHAGGIIGRQVGGSITSSYARVTTTADQKGADISPAVQSYAGGLVAYQDGGNIVATYARGSATAKVRGNWQGQAHAGGLIGYHKNGEIKSSYSEADATAEGTGANFSSPTLNAGGFVGTQDGGAITASYSVGTPATRIGTITNATENKGGLTGNHSSGTTTNSYWDTTSSGITATGQGTGKTTSELKTPTAYGTGNNDIYKDWELDLDNADNDGSDATGKDDQWNFGTASDYPVLQYHLTIPPQRASVTLTVSPGTIWERALTSPSRVNQATVTVTLSGAWHHDVTVTPAADTATYTLGAASVTIAAGSTTGTVSLTAVNNFKCGTSDCPASKVNKSVSLAATTNDPWVSVGTAPTVTINDDDEFTKPTGVKLSVDGTKMRADWTAVTGATGYKVQWSTSSTFASPSEGTVSGGSTTNYAINPTPALTANTRYYVRVLPTKSGADEPPSDAADVRTHATGANATVDYDADNDGLIEITTLAQLNAVRWDLDGDGVAAKLDSNNDGDYTDTGEYDHTASYAAAFPNAEDNMGCNESAVTIASGTGNPACTGYELRASLDFDTDGDGTADSGDTYWNGGAGWTPIGDFTTGFAATFDGNSDTDASGDGGPYALSNLFINASTTADDSTPDIGGLFGRIGNGGVVENVGLAGVSVTVSSTLEDVIHVGALTADNRGTVTGSWSTGSVTGSTDQNNKTAWISVGGLVGRNDKGGSGDAAYEGVVRDSYSYAAVTGKGRRQANGGEARVGGLVGVNKGTIAASYAAGNVTATNSVSGTELNKGLSGGLVGVNSGTIVSSYSRGGVSSSATNVTAGGLVGDNESGGTITASFSTGAVTNSVDNTPDIGGLAGANAGSSTNSYWDTQTSGQSSSPTGVGKTTSELQTPTSYGSTSSIYHVWNVNVDGVSGDDDPWDFGTANQYPVLKHGAHAAADQRATVTLSVSPATIWESNAGSSTRATASTLTATLDRAWNEDVAVTVPTNAAYTSSATTITISAGSTTGTATLTAVNNFKCGTSACPSAKSNNTVALTQATHPAGTKWIVKGTDASITINDDDELAKPTGVKLTVDGTKIRVDWTQVTGATGYKVQWNTSDAWSSPSEGTVSSGNTTNYTINPSTPLTANTRYYVRVLPTKSGADEPPSGVKDTTTRASAGTGDYDADNDGLIEISSLAQLNAVRWDLDGNGAVDSATNAASYAAAFPNAEDNMGCNESVVTIASGPGNPPCTGYELAADLDFDTDGDGTADSGDTYWNGGAGWDPIGGGATAYTGEFDGNRASYAISNLFIDRDATATGAKYYAGLFGRIDTGADIRNVKLTGVSVTLENTTTENPQPEVYAGGLVGYQKAGTVTGSSVVGTVKAVVKPVTPSTTTTNPANAGGLVGYKKAGDVISSFARATVTAEQNASAGSLHAHAGGLVGVNEAGGVIASYSAGSASAKVSATNGNAYAGGLVGEHEGGDIKAAYSYAAASASNSGSSNTSVSLYAAGLVGHQNGGNITASYSTGAPTTVGDGATVTEYKGGLVGRSSSGTTTDGYWDTEKSGITATGQGTGKTGSELRTPTAYGTGANDIYKDWDIDLDTTTAGTQDGWDFGTASQYPVIKHGLTPADQRVTVTLSALPTTIWERALTTPSRVNFTTITATLSEALLNAVVVTLPTDANVYTLGSSTLTIAAGSTSTTTTLTAVNNRVDAANKPVHMDRGASADDPRVGVTSAQPTLTINDDDELASPTGGTVYTPGNVPTTVRVQWNPVTHASLSGYKIQYKLTTSSIWGSEITVATTACTGVSITLCWSDITGLTVGSLYDFRVWATAAATGIDEGAYAEFAGGPGTDYDTDDDGLIEITSLAQLDAVRYDLDGDGTVTGPADSTAYNAAFPSPKDKMGCEEAKATPSDRKCIGYELKTNLDFDTGTKGDRTDDTYWNSGQGWEPIGGTNGTQYTALFDGNSNSDTDGGPYVISNLFINRTSGNYAGLFAYLNGADGAEVTQVALENVDVTLNVDATDFVYVGALAGKAETDIIRSYSTGEVNSTTKMTSAHKYLFIGGLVGQLRDANILSGYSWADVTGSTGSSTAANRTHSGGLVGMVGQLESSSPPTSQVIASYAAGDVSATTSGSNHAKAGGLTGQVGYGGSVISSYARGDVHGGGGSGNNYRGALAGYQYGNITASFATGRLTGSHSSNRCGLVGYRNSGSTTNSYYDSSNLGQSGCNSSNGTGKTTSELQTPTGYTGIYANWNLDLDNADNDDNRTTGTDSAWDLGEANQYPALFYGGLVSADQRPTVDLTASPTTLHEAVGGATSSTLTATMSTKWNKDVAVTIPAAADGLTVTNSPLSFTSGASGNWGTAQTGTVKLAAAPSKTIVVDFTRLDVNDPEVTPKYLTFTTTDWNTAQNVSVKFLAEPTAGTTRVGIEGTGNSKTYKVDLGAYRRPYYLGNPAVIVAEGATTGTVTLTAQNDYNDLANASATLTIGTHPTDSDWISKGSGTAPGMTFTDDDELGQVTGVAIAQKTAVGNLGGGATVGWTKVTGATGYIVEWKSGTEIYDSSRRLVAGDVATYDIPASNLAPGTAYDIRVYATKSGSDHGLPSDEVDFAYTGWLVFSETSVTIAEPSTGTATGTYTVRLSSQPAAQVTVALGYRVPQITRIPSSITFNSTNWSQWQPFAVEADQYPPRGPRSVDYTCVTFSDTSTLDFEVNTWCFFDREKITFRVKRKSNPNGDDTVDLTKLGTISVPSAHQITASPTSLTFTTTDWNTAQTVTLSTPADDTGHDEEEVFVHTATSTGADYGGVTGRVTGKQTDGNTAPTSEDFTHRVKAKSSAERTNLRAGTYFAFSDADGDTLSRVLIVTLPDAAQGELKLYSKDNSSNFCRRFPTRPRCKSESPIFAGKLVVAYVDPGVSQPLMHFYPTGAFASASFTYKVVDSKGNASDSAYTVTLLPEGGTPVKPANLAATPGDGKVELAWDDPGDTSITEYEYRYRDLGGPPWSDWTDIPNSGATTTSHTVTSLTNSTNYRFQLRAVNSSGAGPIASVDARPVPTPTPARPGGFTDTAAADKVALSWSDPGDSSIVKYQVRQREQEGDLSAVAGNGQVTLLWDNPNDPTIHSYRYRYKAGSNEFGAWTSVPASGANTTSVTVGSLANNSLHTFQVQAVIRESKDGNVVYRYVQRDDATATPSTTGGWTDITAALTSTPSTLTFTTLNWSTAQTATVKLPAAPAADVKIALAQDNVEFTPSTLTFTTTDWNTAQNVSVKLKAAPAASVTVSLATGFPANATSRDVTGLTQGKLYAFQLRAVNAVGSGPATAWVHSARLPAKPAGLTATPGDRNVTLAWTVPSPAEPNITRWQYREGSNSWTDIPNSTGTTTSHVVTGLTNGTNYTFKVRAVNAGGDGPDSDSATAIPGAAPAKPAGFTATPGDASVALAWTDPNNSAITAWEYRQTEPKGGLTAFANSREVELSWDSPSDTSGIARWLVSRQPR